MLQAQLLVAQQALVSQQQLQQVNSLLLKNNKSKDVFVPKNRTMIGNITYCAYLAYLYRKKQCT